MSKQRRNMRSDQKQNIATNLETRRESTIEAHSLFISPVRRIKGTNCIQNISGKKLKSMKSEKCNFINKRENGEHRWSTPTATTAFSDCEGKRKSTSTCIGSSKRLSSSTPRRKRNMLANLYSDLSPKYIGFTTPPSTSIVAITGSESDNSLQTRSARHRKLFVYAASPEIEGNDSEILTDASKILLGCVRRAQKPSITPSPNRLRARKKFESPIDKLLALNGSVVLNDISKEKIVNNLSLSPSSNLNIIYKSERELFDLPKKSESVIRVECENNNVTNLVNMDLKQINNINDSLITENIEDYKGKEKSHIANLIKKESVNVVKYSEREIANSSKNENYVEEIGGNVETFSTELYSGDNFINPTATVKIENDSFNNTTDCKLESIENHIDNADTELQYDLEEGESGESMILNNVVGFSAKSPSAVSLDSAKGSSVVTGMDWMTFSTGDIFWGQIYTYCYWPCIVCPDPEGNTISTERNLRNGEEYVLVHVRFFADSGRRNWVKRENLIPYTDLENYKQHMREIRKKFGKKSVKYKVLLPKPSKVMIWREAIKEANKVCEIVYEDRLTKFFEIYEHKKVLQKIQRKKRKLSTDKNSRTDSLSHDSMESLIVKNPLASGKRDRSVSPYSPAYSPLKPLSSTKRRKLSDSSSHLLQITENSSGENEDLENSNNNVNSVELKETEANSSTSFAAMHEMEMCNSEYRKFYNAMREFVLEDNIDECLERSLMVASRNIWALKQINNHQVKRRLLAANNKHELGSSLVENRSGDGAVKRLSNRLKTLRYRHSLPTQLKDAQHLELQEKLPGAEGEVQIVDKPKRVLNRPIEEVIDDIFNLDNKYLFRGLARDPVCKYCLHPGGPLVRCAKGCQTWLHADCIGKDPTTLKKARNGGRRKSSINARRSSSKLSIDIKPSLENPSMPKSNEYELPGTASALTTYHVTADEDADDRVIIKISPEVICDSCALGKPPVCAVCKEDHTSDTNKEELIMCNMPQCSKTFHPGCCRYWPQAKFTKSKNKIESFRCPSHVCHTCVSDDPKGKFQHLSNSKLTKCVKCPASYHMDSTCIPAGSQILTAAHIICPRHSASSKSDAHVNVSWCFICVGGGQVICCETCPTAVHAKCLNIPLDPSEGYICEECESGRMPLYGEMVWAKFNSFRWWPAIILPPTEIPQNIRRKAHNTNDFVVRFFGTHDHGWISRRRVYLYLEGDSSEPPKTKSSLDQSYNRGVEEAKRIYEIIKSKKMAQRISNENKEKLHPQPYVRIKANRAVHPVKLHIDLEKVNKCECRSYDENPCGPNSNCLNRVLYHECNPKLCPAGERCQNQMFESRLSPRLDVVYLKERGFGLVCRENINAGDFIIEYVGEIIDDNEFKQRMSQKSLDRDENFYFLSVERDYIIDAGPKGNLARFMNHSCDPNCETQKWSVNGLNRIGLFAIKDIPADTELTFNYHWDDLLGNQKKVCLCGAVKCVGEIGGKNKEDKISKENTAVDANKAKVGATRKRKPLKRLQNRPREGNEKKVSKKRSNVTVKIPERIVKRVGDQKIEDENNISFQNGDNPNNTADKSNEDYNTTNIF